MKHYWMKFMFCLKWMKWYYIFSGIGIKAISDGFDKESVKIIKTRWKENNPEPKFKYENGNRNNL